MEYAITIGIGLAFCTCVAIIMFGSK